jgi:hypothetical protein
MKISNTLMNLGRVVAYHPNLKKITNSTTATILLCQLLYWTPKSKDGWIWKTVDEIEEETGLTQYEQKTARESLIEEGLIFFEFKRLDHTSRYFVNQKKLDALWEKVFGKEEAEKPQPTVDTQAQFEELFGKAPEQLKVSASRVAPEKKGDAVDAMIAYSTSPVALKIEKMKEIREQLETKLDIICDDAKWNKFIEFAYTRQEKYSEPVDVFINYALREGFHPIYWTPEKCKTVYPQAFKKDTSNEPVADFVEKLPDIKEEEYAPMPKSIGRQRSLE